MSVTTSRPIAVGLGEVLWDLLPAGKQLGGAPANFAYHAQQLGAQSSVVSAVGADALGDEIAARVAALGLDVSQIARDRDHPTGTVSVKLDAAGVPEYVIHTGVAWDFIPHTAALDALAGRTDVVCFGSLAQRSPTSRQTIRAFLAATRRDHCLRVFDINLRQNYFDADIVHRSLELANVLKLNDQELPVIAKLLTLGGEEGDVVAELIKRYPLRLVALTRGDKGSSLFSRDAASHHRGYPTKLVDTVGAGDSFTAAVAIGLLRGLPLDKINDAANRLAAYVCSQHGAMPPMPRELTAWATQPSTSAETRA